MTGFTKKSVLDRFPTAEIVQETVSGDTKAVGTMYMVRLNGELLGCGSTPRAAWFDAAQSARYNTRWSEA